MARSEAPSRLAARGRAIARRRGERLLAVAPGIAQASFAAGAAWALALVLLPAPQPIFAPVTALVALGITTGRHGRAALELALGAVVGVGVADLLVHVFGGGPWQLVVFTALAMAAARLLAESTQFILQAGVSGVLIVALEPVRSGYPAERVLEALLGGAVALVVSQLVMPIHPQRMAERGARAVVEHAAAALERMAGALRAHDVERSERALGVADGLAVRMRALDEAIMVAAETAQLSPARRRMRGAVGRYRRAASRMEALAHDTGGLAVATSRIARGDATPPPGLADALEELAAAARLLHFDLAGGVHGDADSRRLALEAVARAHEVLEEAGGGFSLTAAVSQIRAVAVDVLRVSGLDREQAVDAVAATGTAGAYAAGV